MNTKIQNKLAFTLVELIVVITIVWILSTVGFVSYSGYLTGARDSNRFSQLTKLSDSLQTYAASKTLPLPDDYVEITSSGSENIIAYQGYVWVDVLETIDYTNGGKDPKDDSYFTYYLTKDRKSLQLLALMEDSTSVALKGNNELYAADYSERFPKVYGKKLWVLVSADDSTLNTPVQEISTVINGSGYLDVFHTNNRYKSYIDETSILEWTGAVLKQSIENYSCKRIRETGWSKWNWFYNISPNWYEKNIFCLMEWDIFPIEDMLEWEGSFETWENVSTYVDPNGWTNTFILWDSPIDSNYIVHQTGVRTWEYQLQLPWAKNCKVGESIYMTVWLTWEDGNVFHSYDSYVQHNTTTSAYWKILNTKIVNGVTWEQHQYAKTITQAMVTFNWYLGYNSEDPSDFYFTWVRFSCY